jgi:two-component system cell cycle response regulator
MSERAPWSTRQKILIVAPDDHAGERHSRCFIDAGYHVTRYKDTRKVVELTREESPDLVLVSLEGMDEEGQAAFVAGCSNAEIRVPTLVLAASGDGLTGSMKGACCLEWIDQTTDCEKLLTRIRAMLRVSSDGNARGGGKRDGLTKVYNRRFFDERIEMEIERARRYGRKLSCVMVDIDNFKEVNSAHGHRAGDDVLKVLADVLLSNTRSSDIVARYGGEEFVVIIPESSGSEAAVLAERLRRVFENSSGCFGSCGPVTVSCGVATYPDHASDSATLLRMADSAVYRAKAAGCNQCVIAFSDTDEDLDARDVTAGKILLVEDDDYDRSIASLVLRASGYEVVEARDGANGVTLAQSEHPDLVIVDLQIAGMSGIETTRQIIQTDGLGGIPVVALTAAGRPDDLEELARIGCRGYITKPIDTNMLASQIELYLEG